MAAELGLTSDPAALIPGDSDAVHNTEWSLTVYGDMLHEAGAGLGHIDTTHGWKGQAADQFRKGVDGQPAR
jgi:Putative T7SS secretion signal domain